MLIIFKYHEEIKCPVFSTDIQQVYVYLMTLMN